VTVSAPAALADPAAATAAARALVPELAARAADHDAAGVFPAADFADLRTAGLLGLMVPPRLGGPGAGFADYAEVAVELGAGAGATALVFNMHASVTGALAQTPDDVARAVGVPESYFAMRDRALSQAADGALFAVAMSERGVGSRLSKRPLRLAAAGHLGRLRALARRRRARRRPRGRRPVVSRRVRERRRALFPRRAARTTVHRRSGPHPEAIGWAR